MGTNGVARVTARRRKLVAAMEAALASAEVHGKLRDKRLAEAESARLRIEAIDARERVRRPANPTATGESPQTKGGKARAAALSPERRSELARLAARARWGPPAP